MCRHRCPGGRLTKIVSRFVPLAIGSLVSKTRNPKLTLRAMNVIRSSPVIGRASIHCSIVAPR